jgi:hypothetical protein
MGKEGSAEYVTKKKHPRATSFETFMETVIKIHHVVSVASSNSSVQPVQKGDWIRYQKCGT